MTVTEDRAKVLDFTDPYYYTPAGLAVQQGKLDHVDRPIWRGKTIGVCGACTYESYLNRDLNIPGYTSDLRRPADVTLKTYDTDSTAIQDLALGRAGRRHVGGPDAAGCHRQGQADPAARRPGVLRAARRGDRQERAARPTTSWRRFPTIIDEMHADGTLTAAVAEVVRART